MRRAGDRADVVPLARASRRPPPWSMLRGEAFVLLVAAACCRSITNAQTVAPSDGHGIHLPTEQGCPFEQFPTKIAALNVACCPASLAGLATDPCATGMPTSCSLDCGAVLFPLIQVCRSMIDLVFDSDDGSLDGVASQFDNLADQCRAVGSPAVLDRIRELQTANCVVDTNGVGETTVVEGESCADLNPSCTMAVEAGLLSCAVDLCPDPSCSHSSQCDLTCGFCSQYTWVKLARTLHVVEGIAHEFHSCCRTHHQFIVT